MNTPDIYNNSLFGIKMARRKFVVPVLALFMVGLAACVTTIPFQVEEFNSVTFSSSKMIRIEAGVEIVKLSSRLGDALTSAGFNIAHDEKGAEYILTFDYNAKFDVYPWVITSFTLTIIDAASKNVVYKITSTQSGREPVNSVIQRIVADMSSKFLTNPIRGNVAIIDSGAD